MKTSFFSPAKLNLVLDLVRKREDGYHEVSFFMQELELNDAITIEDQPSGITLSVNPEGAMPLDSSNLIWKGIEILQQEFGITNGVHVHVDKKIPAAGGLGGGSSNAANVMKFLAQHWGLPLNEKDLVERAIQLGMDCAFPIIGNSCIATGRGEILQRTASPPPLDLLIILPIVNVPEAKTKWIYSHFDVNRVVDHPSVTVFQQAIDSNHIEKIAAGCGNAFEQGLKIPEYEPVWTILNELRNESGILNAFLAGAGPTVVAIGNNSETLNQLAKKFQSRSDIKLVCITKTKA